MLPARDLRQKAREALSGRWATAVGAGVITAILGGGTFSDVLNVVDRLPDSVMENFYDLNPIVIALFMWLLSVAAIWGLLIFIIGGPIQLGYARFNLDLVDQREVRVKQVFSGFDCFGKAFVLNLLTGIFVFLWTLLLIIPGIIASFRYAMAFYILEEHPEMSAMEAINESKAMMDGHKWQLFCLELSFLGWMILATLTAGIGYLWLSPYMSAAIAAFYREVSQDPLYTRWHDPSPDQRYQSGDING